MGHIGWGGREGEKEHLPPILVVLEAKPFISLLTHRLPEVPSVLESIASFTISDQTIRRNITE